MHAIGRTLTVPVAVVVLALAAFMFPRPALAEDLTVMIGPDRVLWAGGDMPEANAGSTITFVNNDSVAHEIRADRFPELGTGRIEPGQSGSFVVTQAEKFGCVIHPEMRWLVFVPDGVSSAAPPPSFSLKTGTILPGQETLELGVAVHDLPRYLADIAEPGYIAVLEDSGSGTPGDVLGSIPLTSESSGALVPVPLSRALVDGETLWVGLFREVDGEGFDPTIDVPFVVRGPGNITRDDEVLFQSFVQVPPTPGPNDVPHGGGDSDAPFIKLPTNAPPSTGLQPVTGNTDGNDIWAWVSGAVAVLLLAGGTTLVLPRLRKGQRNP